MANLLLFCLPAMLGLLILQPAAAIDSNYLLSGQTLGTNDRLTYADKYDWIIQDNCGLVLYPGGWKSGTANKGKGCTLTLNHNGQLVIRAGNGATVWTSGPKSVNGNYTAVLHPEGKVIVYGPEVWSPRGPIAHGVRLRNTPHTRNMLFSGQVLYSDGKLTERNNVLVMQGDCNLVLYDHTGQADFWQSNTHGNGQYCFLRLNHKGELAIKDDDYRTVWRRGGTSKRGEYVFILQDDGRTVVYGPAIWSTKPLGSMVTNHEEIAMVTAKKDAK